MGIHHGGHSGVPLVFSTTSPAFLLIQPDIYSSFIIALRPEFIGSIEIFMVAFTFDTSQAASCSYAANAL